jgi:hypothetical protein|nr:YXWGXW repeat-containing protein [Kofleriaceae bacterium]
MRVRAVIAVAVAVAGCYRDAAPVPPGASADIGPPPAELADAPPAKAGMVWVPGRWARSGDRWVWLAGYFESLRPGYRFEPGRWVEAPDDAKRGSAAGDEWASTVRGVSSEYSADGWSAKQALGAPDVFPQQQDAAQAWASLTPDAPEEFIEVGFATPMRAVGADIYETFNPGAVARVELIGASSTHAIATTPSTDQPLRARMPCSSEPIAAVRVVLESSAVPGWNEIDAIGLVPCD